MSMRVADRRRILHSVAAAAAALLVPTGRTLAETGNGATLPGVTSEATTRLSQSEFDAMIARLRDLWKIPDATGAHARELRVTIRIRLGRDRRLAAPPVVTKGGKTQLAQAAAEAAIPRGPDRPALRHAARREPGGLERDGTRLRSRDDAGAMMLRS
ncbi:MAG: hypothetical protein FWD68_11995 [Alphaproteobacteria bacterium]|nr:hypothetical protein [Alphaproteobacteria bacterium]